MKNYVHQVYFNRKNSLMSITFIIGFILFGFISSGFTNENEKPINEVDKQLWEQAKDIANRISLIDCHSHDLFKPVSRIFPKQVDIAMIKKTGVNGLVQCYPIDPRKKENPKEYVISELKKLKTEIDNDFKLIQNAEEFSNKKGDNKIAILLGLEYSHGLFEGNIESLDEYYSLGVRTIGINNGGKDVIYENTNDDYKISSFGAELINKTNKYGIACDVTHLPDTVRQMIIDISDAPVYVSHANVRGVVNEPFNLSDSTLHRLTSKGGIVGLTFFSEYVSEACLEQRGEIKNPLELPRATIEEFVDHIDYIKKKVGIDFICIGSDYGGSGRISPTGLETIEGFPRIIYSMLKRSYTEEEINKVMGSNFINFLKRVEKHANN